METLDLSVFVRPANKFENVLGTYRLLSQTAVVEGESENQQVDSQKDTYNLAFISICYSVKLYHQLLLKDKK